MQTSQELVRAIFNYRNGNIESFNQIYEESYRYFYTCVWNVTRNEEVSQDMLQETYMEIVKNMHQLKKEEDFLKWGAVIANRKCYAYMKSHNHQVLFSELTDEEDENYVDNIADDESIIPEEIMQDKEKQRLVREIIAGLSPVQRYCIVRFYFNEESQENIGQELGIPVNTVKSHLNRAKAKIKHAVEELADKKQTKLYSLAPFMLLLFTEEMKACEVAAISSNLTNLIALQASNGSAIAASQTMAAGQVVSGAAAIKTGILTKIAIGVVAAGVGIGGVIHVVHKIQDDKIKETPTVTVESTKEDESIIEEGVVEQQSKETETEVETQSSLVQEETSEETVTQVIDESLPYAERYDLQFEDTLSASALMYKTYADEKKVSMRYQFANDIGIPDFMLDTIDEGDGTISIYFAVFGYASSSYNSSQIDSVDFVSRPVQLFDYYTGKKLPTINDNCTSEMTIEWEGVSYTIKAEKIRSQEWKDYIGNGEMLSYGEVTAFAVNIPKEYDGLVLALNTDVVTEDDLVMGEDGLEHLLLDEGSAENYTCVKISDHVNVESNSKIADMLDEQVMLPENYNAKYYEFEVIKPFIGVVVYEDYIFTDFNLTNEEVEIWGGLYPGSIYCYNLKTNYNGEDWYGTLSGDGAITMVRASKIAEFDRK